MIFSQFDLEIESNYNSFISSFIIQSYLDPIRFIFKCKLSISNFKIANNILQLKNNLLQLITNILYCLRYFYILHLHSFQLHVLHTNPSIAHFGYRLGDLICTLRFNLASYCSIELPIFNRLYVLI